MPDTMAGSSRTNCGLRRQRCGVFRCGIAGHGAPAVKTPAMVARCPAHYDSFCGSGACSLISSISPGAILRGLIKPCLRPFWAPSAWSSSMSTIWSTGGGLPRRTFFLASVWLSAIVAAPASEQESPPPRGTAAVNTEKTAGAKRDNRGRRKKLIRCLWYRPETYVS